MKKLQLTNANAAFAILDEYTGLYGDNGGDSDGPAWLPSDEDDIPTELAQQVIDAGFGQMIDVMMATDEGMCNFLDLSLPNDEEPGQDLGERIIGACETRNLFWAHFGAYGTDDSHWVFAKEED